MDPAGYSFGTPGAPPEREEEEEEDAADMVRLPLSLSGAVGSRALPWTNRLPSRRSNAGPEWRGQCRDGEPLLRRLDGSRRAPPTGW